MMSSPPGAARSEADTRVVAEEAAAVTPLRVELDEALLTVLADESWGGSFRLRIRAVVGALGRAFMRSRTDLVAFDTFLMLELDAHVLLHLVARRSSRLRVELRTITRLT
jgi:hypothetical protein